MNASGSTGTLTDPRKCVHDYAPHGFTGRIFGRAFIAKGERCKKCGAQKLPRAAVREAKRDAKREALMIARAEIAAREGRTAKQRHAARELIA